MDIGGTKMMSASSPPRRDAGQRRYPTLVDEGVTAVTDRLVAAIAGCWTAMTCVFTMAASASLRGGIDTGRGMVVTPSHNMPDWSDVPLVDIIKEKFGGGVFLLNDASAALGEHRYGAGRGVRNLVLFTVGTGIGGGIIADGRLYLGAVGSAASSGT